MPVRHFDSYEVKYVSGLLDQLHADVVRHKGRIEITRDGCDDCCVLISKTELDALEQALAILSDTDGVRAMSGQIAHLAASCSETAGV